MTAAAQPTVEPGAGICCRPGNWQGQARDERTKQWVDVPRVIEGAMVSRVTTTGAYVTWNEHEFYVPEWSIIHR